MNSSATFQVEVTSADAIAFATMSGDWNPLHTSAEHAANTAYRRVVLHGAFSAGLVSRMAGMHLPGRDCLLHGMRLRFVRPIIPPASLSVTGRVVSDDGSMGRVEVTVSDANSGARYVEAGYEYSRHHVAPATERATRDGGADEAADPATIIVTGATGGLGRAVLERLGSGAIGTSRSPKPGLLEVPDLQRIREVIGDRRLSAIVHCAWPPPDNERLTALSNIDGAVEHNVAAPLRQVLGLGQLLQERGSEDALLVLVGSTAAEPGRHNYRMPLYTLGKSLVPTLSRILATELAGGSRRCVALTFDVIEGGMNEGLSPRVRAMHTDRAPSGKLPSPSDVADQIVWVLGNRGFLLSGATIELTGAAIP